MREIGFDQQFPDLFSLDKKGKIRVFKLQYNYIGERQGSSDWLISSKAGLLVGKQKETFTAVTIGKQRRTVEEQTEFKANSLYNEKRDEGYKSHLDLLLKAESEGIEVEKDETVEQLYKKLKITYNTDTKWRMLPMLAEKWKDKKKKVKYPILVQPKLNGVRCLAIFDKDLQEVVLCSRGGKTYNVPHIIEQLTPFFLLNEALVLDGELYCHGKYLQEINGEVSKDGGKCATWVEYHLYDCVINKQQLTRLNDLRIFHRILQDQYQAKDIKLINTIDCHDEADVIAVHNVFVNEGYEGAMVRDPKAFYQISFRDSCLLKVKEFEDEEFDIAGYEVDPNKTVGDSFVFILYNNIASMPSTFKARPTGTIREKEIWHKEIDNLIGETVTTRFQERSKDGLPTQGHVRHTDSKALMEVLKSYNK